MKKTAKIFLIMTVVVAALLTTSCDFFKRAKAYYEETYDTWYKYKKEVKIPIAGDEGDNRTDGTLDHASVYVKFNAEDGLDVLVCTTQKQTINFMGTPYEVEANVTTGAKKNYPIDEKVNAASWIVIMESGNFEEGNPPEINISLENLMNGKMNFKKLLVQLLLGTLED